MEPLITTPQVVESLANWSTGKGPLYRRLSSRLKLAINQGELPPGSRLPPERTLAEVLAVSRSTIVAAYELLRSEGWLESRQGSGTRVASRSKAQLPPVPSPVSVVDRLMRQKHEVIDFTVGIPPSLGNTGTVPQNLMSGLPLELINETGYFPAGLPALRQALVRYYKQKNIPTIEDQILVTNGAQQALALLAKFYLRPGDTALLENPTYFGALDIFRQTGAKLAGVEAEQGAGLKAAKVESLLSGLRPTPKFFYLMPTFQNPTGTVLNRPGRQELIRLAEEYRLALIEDNTLADLELEEVNVPPLAALNNPDCSHVITVGSMSKLFRPGLRVGWIRAHPSIILHLSRLKALNDLGSSLLSQAVSASWLEHLEEIKQLRRQQLLPRRQLLAELLRQYLPEWEWTIPAGGLFLWVKLPGGNAERLAQLAYRRGLAIVPGPAMSVDGSHQRYVRLPFVHSLEEMEEGVKRLAGAWRDYRESTRRTLIEIDSLL